MKFYLITGRTPGVIGRDAYEYIPAQRVQGPGGTEYTIPERPASPAIPAVIPEDIRIEIGETNPFDTSGKPFKVKYHSDLGINNVEDWKRLIQMYAQRTVKTFFVTPEGLRASMMTDPFPASYFMRLLNDGYQKSDIKAGMIEYFKQKGRVEDETGKTYPAPIMISILELK